MKFLLKRRLNPFLLLTTVVALSLLTAVTIVQNEGNRDLSNKLQETRENYNELNESYIKIQNELNVSKSNEEQLQRQISELENQVQNRSQSTESLEQRITELENQTQTLRESRNEYREDFETARGHVLSICEDQNLPEDHYICRIYN